MPMLWVNIVHTLGGLLYLIGGPMLPYFHKSHGPRVLPYLVS